MYIRKPFFCNYWLTYRCNSKCEFCNIWRDASLKDIPDAKFQDVKINLQDLKKLGVKIIDFTGGEPLLNKELPQILDYSKKLGFFNKLSTNGILYSERATELKGLFNRIYFSFDTTSKDEYNKIRGIDRYDKLIKSIDIAKNLGENICLISTITDETVTNIADIVDFSKKKKIPVYIHPCFSYFENKKLNREYISAIKKYFWHPYVRMSLPDLEFHLNGGNDISKPRCKVGYSTMDIGPDNCLTIPCFHKCVERIKINGKLYSLHKSKKWQEMFKNAGKYKFCKNCTIDCYFGFSFFDKADRYFIKENLSLLKNIVEKLRK